MVANKVFLDPRGVDCVFCYTDTQIPLDSIITINDTPAYVSKVFTSADGWNPGIGNSNQGVIGFNYTGTGYTYGDTFVIVNSTGSVPISGYAPGASYGYLNFSATDTAPYPGNYLYKGGDYFNVGTGDFTIEFYFKLTNTNTCAFIYFTDSIDFSTSNKFWIILFGGGMQYATSGSPTSLGLAPTLNEWHHFALSRGTGTFYPYLDGVQGSVFEETTNFVQMLSCFIGGNNLFGTFGLDEVYCLNGSMSNVRVTENVALYTTSSFTPPTPPLSYDANTTILLIPVSEETKYVNSVDNESFINHDNPVTNQAVTFSAGPINYPPPPPNYNVFWTPDTETINWCSGYDSGSCNYGVSLFSFNNSIDITQVRSFNISSINSLTGLNFIVNLESFNITSYDNTFTSFDVSGGSPSLSSFNLNVYYLTNITGLPSLSNLRELDIEGCSFSNINVSSNTALTYLDVKIQHAPLTILTLSANTALVTLMAGNNALTSIDISYNTNLQTLDVGNQPMQTYNTNFSAYGIDISNNSQLSDVDVTSCNLTPSQVDSIIINLNTFGLSSGVLDYTGNSGRTSASDAAYAGLQSKLWSIYY